MGPENSGGPYIAYIDGQPVELVEKPMQFTVAHMENGEIIPDAPDFSMGGVTAEEAATAAGRLAEAWGGLSMTMEVAADGLRAFAYNLELAIAVRTAQVFEPDMARRYIHTKKKRTRKKYEKRILAWFREALG